VYPPAVQPLLISALSIVHPCWWYFLNNRLRVYISTSKIFCHKEGLYGSWTVIIQGINILLCSVAMIVAHIFMKFISDTFSWKLAYVSYIVNYMCNWLSCFIRSLGHYFWVVSYPWGLNQPLTAMSTRNISWRVNWSNLSASTGRSMLVSSVSYVLFAV
jgi:hypothetical protein